MALPLVSVVTPVYNGEEHLRECVESVLRQTYENWQYTIVDNCSTDGTAEIAAEYARADGRIQATSVTMSACRRHRELQPRRRRREPREHVLEGVGADDWIYPECLSAMVELAETAPRSASSARSGSRTCPSAFSASRRSGGDAGVRSPRRPSARADLDHGIADFGASAHGSHSRQWAVLRPGVPPWRHRGRLPRAHAHRFWLRPRVLTFTRRPTGGETSYTHRVNTLMPEFLRMHIRYGPERAHTAGVSLRPALVAQAVSVVAREAAAQAVASQRHGVPRLPPAASPIDRSRCARRPRGPVEHAIHRIAAARRRLRPVRTRS